jgi:hypothetical protein
VSISGSAFGAFSIGDLVIELGSVSAQLVERALGRRAGIVGTGLVPVIAEHASHHENHRQRTGEQ